MYIRLMCEDETGIIIPEGIALENQSVVPPKPNWDRFTERFLTEKVAYAIAGSSFGTVGTLFCLTIYDIFFNKGGAILIKSQQSGDAFNILTTGTVIGAVVGIAAGRFVAKRLGLV